MQKHLPKPDGNTYGAGEFSEFFQENWIYLALVAVIIYIVVMYSKILKDRKRNSNDD
jgi:uncharacterized membrane protein SirB2